MYFIRLKDGTLAQHDASGPRKYQGTMMFSDKASADAVVDYWNRGGKKEPLQPGEKRTSMFAGRDRTGAKVEYHLGFLSSWNAQFGIMQEIHNEKASRQYSVDLVQRYRDAGKPLPKWAFRMGLNQEGDVPE